MGRTAHLGPQRPNRLTADRSETMPRCAASPPGRSRCLPCRGRARVVGADGRSRHAPSHALAVPHAGATAALAVDLTTGQTLFARNATLALVPASNEKLAVTYAALVELGPPTASGPTCSARAADRRRLARRPRAQGLRRPDADDRRPAAARDAAARGGVRRVTGRVLGDESFFDARGRCPSGSRLLRQRVAAALGARRRPQLLPRSRAREPASPPRRASAQAPRAQGIGSRGAVGSAARAAARPRSRRSTRSRSGAAPGWMNTDSDNFMAELLLKQLGAETAAPGTGRAARRSSARPRGRPACRSRACGSSTAAGSRAPTG